MRIAPRLYTSVLSFIALEKKGGGSGLLLYVAPFASWRYLSELQSDQAIVKLDFKNALNTLHRDKMLKVVSPGPYHLPLFSFGVLLSIFSRLGC